MTRALLQQALDALEPISAFGRVGTKDVEQAKLQQAITALREALTAPEPEPVAWYYVEDPWGANEWHFMTDSPESQECDPRDWTPLYATPPVAPAPAAPVVREPLKDEQVRDIARALPFGDGSRLSYIWNAAKAFARAIEKAHGIGAANEHHPAAAA